MAEEIRLNRGVPIVVNDEGETITMKPENQNFIEKFYGLVDKLDDLSAEMQSEAVKQMNEHEQLLLLIERTKHIMAEIDAMFGPESCRKIFGDIVPSHYLIADFFEQLKPIAERYTDGRQKEISKKYNGNRKGARASKYRSKEELIRDAMGHNNV